MGIEVHRMPCDPCGNDQWCSVVMRIYGHSIRIWMASRQPHGISPCVDSAMVHFGTLTTPGREWKERHEINQIFIFLARSCAGNFFVYIPGIWYICMMKQACPRKNKTVKIIASNIRLNFKWILLFYLHCLLSEPFVLDVWIPNAHWAKQSLGMLSNSSDTAPCLFRCWNRGLRVFWRDPWSRRSLWMFHGNLDTILGVD